MNTREPKKHPTFAFSNVVGGVRNRIPSLSKCLGLALLFVTFFGFVGLQPTFQSRARGVAIHPPRAFERLSSPSVLLNTAPDDGLSGLSDVSRRREPTPVPLTPGSAPSSSPEQRVQPQARPTTPDQLPLTFPSSACRTNFQRSSTAGSGSQNLPSVWPQPTQFTRGSDRTSISPSSLSVYVPLDTGVWTVYSEWLFGRAQSGASCGCAVAKLSATVVENATLPLGANEAYTLDVSISRIAISAHTQFGVMHGRLPVPRAKPLGTSVLIAALKTLAQLIDWQDGCGTISGVPIHIEDGPRYPFRGLLIDPPRAFFTLPEVRAVIDRLSLLKLNVLHLRLTDDWSFVFRSKRFPAMAGPFAYSLEDLSALRRYAIIRGVRIIPEIDIPGHAQSWSKTGYAVTAVCPATLWSVGLDPTQALTWTLIEGLLLELTSVFPDDYIHLGGDEVSLACYESDFELMMRARRQDLFSGHAVLQYFRKNLLHLLQTHPLLSARQFVLWEDVYEDHKADMHLFPPATTTFHTWLSTKNGEEVAALGFASIRSTGFYLDVIHGEPGFQFEREFNRIYTTEMMDLDFFDEKWRWNTSTQRFFRGAEACIWEHPYSDFAEKVWPLLSPFAETVWTAAQAKHLPSARERLATYERWIASLDLEKSVRTQPPNLAPIMPFNALRGWDI